MFVTLWLDTISQSLDFEQVSPPGCTFFCRCRLHSTSCWLTELCDFSRRTMTVSNCGLISWCLLEHGCYQHRRLALVNVFHHFLCIDVYIFSFVAIYSFFRWCFTPVYKKLCCLFLYRLLCVFLSFFLSVLILYVFLSLFLFLSYSSVFCSSCLGFCSYLFFWPCTFLACIRKY